MTRGGHLERRRAAPHRRARSRRTRTPPGRTSRRSSARSSRRTRRCCPGVLGMTQQRQDVGARAPIGTFIAKSHCHGASDEHRRRSRRARPPHRARPPSRCSRSRDRACCGGNTSRLIGATVTVSAAPATPCTKRAAVSASSECERQHAERRQHEDDQPDPVDAPVAEDVARSGERHDADGQPELDSR